MLLSICIPTKNRAKILAESLKSIVSQSIFLNSNDIEIIISDNASTDNTSDIVNLFIEQYPGKIRYYKNEVDFGGKNFEIALGYGRGELLKLANDSLSWLPGSLEMIIKIIHYTIDNKPPIFFLNNSKSLESSIITFKDVAQFMELCSYYVTWIGGFSIWKSKFESFNDFSRCVDLLLPQTDVFLRTINESSFGVISNTQIVKIITVGRKGGYNIAEVFGRNYLKILSDYTHCISESIMATLKRDIFENHILPFYFNDDHDFGNIDLISHLPEFVDEPYFTPLLNSIKIKYDQARIKNYTKNAPVLWRNINAHNETEIKNLFNFDRVKVGRCTYGALHVYQWGNQDEFLEIGNYVSIADGVTFLTGGNHQYDGITTFPVKVKFLGHPKEALTNGKIHVGDDVWIGHNVLILSGVHIGQGSIIGAGSVVTKDISPYSIVGGSPAKLIKFRFSDEIIKEMLKIRYEKIEPKHLIELGVGLYEGVDSPIFHKSLARLIEISNS